MCPFWPFHLFFVYASILAPLWILSSSAVAHIAKYSEWGVEFSPYEVRNLPIGNIETVEFNARGLTAHDIDGGTVAVVVNQDGTVASIHPEAKTYILNTETITDSGDWHSAFNISGNFLGYARVNLQLKNAGGDIVKQSNSLLVTVVRPVRVIDTVFVYSVAILVSVIYINFGCALDWVVFRKTIRKPIGPVIGFVCQFVLMPVLSFGLAKILFPSSVAMQLGMFFTGVSPAGGASNIWTYVLGGNLNLSITMTTISTFAAFAMMPLWIFSLGQLIFKEGHFEVPYSRIAMFAVGLVIPLAIGFLIQKYLPRVSKIMIRILKPFSALLIMFIVIFAIITNLYLFELFTWQIIVAGVGLPWLGYLGGLLLARICKQPPDDILAISIETGIQNTGIAIFLLQFSLGQPEADLTTVVPVAVAIMTPVPLLMLFIYYRFSARWKKSKGMALDPEEEEKISPLPSTNGSTEPFAIGIGNTKYRESHLHQC